MDRRRQSERYDETFMVLVQLKIFEIWISFGVFSQVHLCITSISSQITSLRCKILKIVVLFLQYLDESLSLDHQTLLKGHLQNSLVVNQ